MNACILACIHACIQNIISDLENLYIHVLKLSVLFQITQSYQSSSTRHSTDDFTVTTDPIYHNSEKECLTKKMSIFSLQSYFKECSRGFRCNLPEVIVIIHLYVRKLLYTTCVFNNARTQHLAKFAFLRQRILFQNYGSSYLGHSTDSIIIEVEYRTHYKHRYSLLMS